MRHPLLLFIIVLAAYALTAAGHLFSPDEEILFRTTRALATEATLAIEPIPDQMGGTFGSRKANPPRADGREYGQYGVGQPILATPCYWAGALLGHFGSNTFWQRVYSQQPQTVVTAAELAPRWACSWFNIFLGALLAVLLYGVCLELTHREQVAFWTALLYALGSMAWAHSRPFFSESCATFFVLLAWYGLLRATRERLLFWCALAGAAAGYAALVRMDSALAYPGLAVLLCGPIFAAARRQGRSFLAAWAAFCIPALIAGAVLLGLNKLHFGGFLKTGYSDQPEGVAFSTPILAGLYGFIFSIGKGLFFFSPALALSFVGWRHLFGKSEKNIHPALPWAVVAAIAVPLAVHSTWQNWPGGWCWGPRHIFIIHAFLALPIACWLAAAGRGVGARMAVGCFLLAGILVNLLGASQDFMTYHTRYFRTPVGAAYVVYDAYDENYWNQYYEIMCRPEPGGPLGRVSLHSIPRPIQDSIYIPQASVWNGYQDMVKQGFLDNFWYRLALELSRPTAPARIAAPKP